MENRTYTADAAPGDDVTVAGWVHEVRDLGGIAFLILRDTTGRIQVKFEKEEMDDALVETGLDVPRESVISVTGAVEEEPRAPPASRSDSYSARSTPTARRATTPTPNASVPSRRAAGIQNPPAPVP